MTYFTKNFSAEILLPDGTVASSSKDIDRYLKANRLALQSDYSAAYMQNIRWKKQVAHQKEVHDVIAVGDSRKPDASGSLADDHHVDDAVSRLQQV